MLKTRVTELSGIERPIVQGEVRGGGAATRRQGLALAGRAG